MSRRFDPDDRERRALAYAERMDTEMPDPARFNVIDGTRNPELFTPTDLFEHLISSAFHDDAETRTFWRNAHEEDFDEALPADFWTRLEAAFAPYLAINTETRRLGRQIGGADQFERARLAALVDDKIVPKCRARFQAIQAARQDFGDLFDRFLYGPVADGLVQIDDSTQAEFIRSRQREEGECE